MQKVKYIEVSKLNLHTKNPRFIKDESFKILCESIKSNPEFFEARPIIASDRTKKLVIIAGNQRFKAAKEIGLKKVPVTIFTGLTQKKEKEIILRDNVTNGEWDLEMLGKEFDLDSLKEFGVDIDFDTLPAKEGKTDPEEVPEPSAGKPITKPGNMWRLGEHLLLCGDSTNFNDVKTLMGKEKADMVFTDPPYNIDYSGGMNEKNKNAREKILNDKMTKENFSKFLQKATDNMLKTCRGCVYICMSSYELDTLKKVFIDNGGHFQSFIIWVKNTFTLSRADWQSQYEPILYGWPKGVINHYFVGCRNESNVWQNLDKLKPEITDEGKMIIKLGDYHLHLDQVVTGKVIIKRQSTDIWHEKKPNKNPDHPTMKPLKLVEKAVKASSKAGDIVQDIFGGSGSTLIVCEMSHRKCRTMELDPKYCDVIIKRWEEFTGDKAELLKH